MIDKNVWSRLVIAVICCVFIYGCGTVSGGSSTDAPPGNYVQIGNRFFTLKKDGADIWLGTDRGVFKYSAGGEVINYSESDGLVSDYVYSIAVDNDGVMWFGTYAGLSSFDGNTWTSYTESDGILGSKVFALAIDKNNDIWCGTDEGLNKFDGETWTTFDIDDGLTYEEVYSILIDSKDNIWVGTGSRLNKLEGNKFKIYSTHNSEISSNIILSIKEDKDGNIWFGTFDGLNKYDGNMIKQVSLSASTLPDKQIYAVDFDSNGDMVIGTRAGVSVFNGNKWVNFDINNGLVNNKVNSVIVDDNDDLWIATTSGLSILEYDNFAFSDIDNLTVKGMVKSVNNVNAVVQDIFGVYWMATKKGLLKKDGVTYTLYKKEDGLADGEVNSIVIDPANKIWCGTKKGLSCFDGSIWTNFGVSDGLLSNNINTLVLENNTLWIGTIKGINSLNIDNLAVSSTNYSVSEGLPSYYITSLSVSGDSSLWVATASGLAMLRDEEIDTTYTSSNGLPDNFVQTVYSDTQNRVWAGTRSGYAVFDSSLWSIPEEQPVSSSILSFYSEKDTSWIGTWDGVNMYDTTSYSLIGGRKVNHIYRDKNKKFWFATSSGPISLSDNIWNEFKWEEKLGDGTVNTIAYDTGGNIWIGLNDGLVSNSGSKWSTYLESVKVNDIVFDTFALPWLATDSGLYKPDDSTWTILDASEGLSGSVINDISFFNSTMWIATDKSLSNISGDIITNYETTDGLNGLPVYALTAENNNILCGTSKGVNILTQSGWKFYDTAYGIIGSNIYDMVFSNDGSSLWTATDKGVSELMYDSAEISLLNNYDSSNGLPAEKVSAIVYGPDNNVLGATANGLFEITDNDDIYIYDSTQGILPSSNIKYLSIDYRGAKTVGTDKGYVLWDSTKIQITMPGL